MQNFVKGFANRKDKKAAVTTVVLPQFNGNDARAAEVVITHLLGDRTEVAQRVEDAGDFFALSPAVTKLSQNLIGDLQAKIGNARDLRQTTNQLVMGLQASLLKFKSAVQHNQQLSKGEQKALLALVELQTHTIGATVDFANGLGTTVNGRGFFSKLISVVVTVVVAAVVVAAAVVGGVAVIAAAGYAMSATTVGTAVAAGAVAGGVYGAAVGYDQAFTHDNYFTDFNPGNVRGGFLNWDQCGNNPSTWACR